MDIASLYRIFREHPIVTTDSRHCPKGSLFFALKGASFNGNDFARQALDKGCAYAVVDDPARAGEADERLIPVEDCLTALQQLANYHRRQLGTRIIAITGTNGKTTTKELTAAVLTQKYHVLYTEGNLNNHIGVPLTLLGLTARHDMAVVEMGANHPGEIAALARIAEPDYGLITNVGKAHLEGFGSFEGVIRTKGELYDFLRTRQGGTVFLHHDNPYLNRIAQGLHAIRYGQPGSETPLAVCGEATESSPFLSFRWRTEEKPWHSVQTHLIGAYNTDNLLAAVAVGLHFGVPAEEIDRALTDYVPRNNRSQWVETATNRLIVDAYNANPTSMKAALTNFLTMNVHPKMVILGDMKELGASSAEEHQKVVEFLQANPPEEVWLTGECFAATGSPFRHFAHVEEVKEALRRQPPCGFHILIKGSNSMKLSQLTEYL